MEHTCGESYEPKLEPKLSIPAFLRIFLVKLTGFSPKSFKWLLARLMTSNPANLEIYKLLTIVSHKLV